MSKAIFLYKMLATACILVLIICLATDALAETRVVDVHSCLRVRTGPGTDFHSRWSLANGAVVEILNWSGDWVQIAWPKYPDSPIGWVHGGYLR